eukprot:TRINITY_DN3867_c0_g1_i1.p1 TRINITY_DN3867_c0_g1~~TRINITY_DN3867_c0_g1_i1.p1  ORF type:complete len:448 (+),score=155.54 TRINITY_DN3867_c0_g1_i1:66-1409(+)
MNRKEEIQSILKKKQRSSSTYSMKKYYPWIMVTVALLIAFVWNKGTIDEWMRKFDAKEQMIDKYKQVLKDPNRFETMDVDTLSKAMEGYEDPFIYGTASKVQGIENARQICSNGYSTTLLLSNPFNNTNKEEYKDTIIQFGIGKSQGNYLPVHFNEEIDSIYCGDYFTLALTKLGRVYSWGREYSPLAHPNHSNSPETPTLIDNLFNISRLAVGQNHVLALSKDGKLYSWGEDMFGESGVLLGKKTKFPVLISLDGYNNEKVVGISAGGFHSLILTENGKVFYFGQYHKDLGLDYSNSIHPTPILPHLSFKAIECGGDHLFLQSEDKVYSWGWSEKGQLGFIAKDRVILEPIEIAELSNQKIKSIVGGKYAHTLALLDDGKVLGWGWNEQGQLGIGDNKDRFSPQIIPNLDSIVQIDGGFKHSVALNDKGEVFTFGEDVYGQLGRKS